MGKLILDSLEIKNFRAFQHLTIERLGRVNLIVGKNNVGKTSLLEALWLYASRGSSIILQDLLLARDESKTPSRQNLRGMDEKLLATKYLFYGREEINIGKQSKTIQIGSASSDDEALYINAGWYALIPEEDGSQSLELIKSGENVIVDDISLRISVRLGTQQLGLFRFNRPTFRAGRFVPDNIPCIRLLTNGLDRIEIETLWDNIVLTNLEEDVLKALRVISPNIERVNLISSQENDLEERIRIPIVKLKGVEEPIPLGSMGEGMHRMFGIALTLVNAKNSLLLVDEIDTGLHYSVQSEMWKLVFETAHRLNIQVFATTHSWDCIEAFQKAAQENEKEEGLLILLQEKKGQIVSTIFDERELGIATREGIEVR
jgi:AAA15 family ATPase/GTPase